MMVDSAEKMEYAKLEELLVEETWLEALEGELQKPYAKNLCRFVEREMRGSVPIYPPPHLIFDALHRTPFHQVKAVIIGQVCSRTEQLVKAFMNSAIPHYFIQV